VETARHGRLGYATKRLNDDDDEEKVKCRLINLDMLRAHIAGLKAEGCG